MDEEPTIQDPAAEDTPAVGDAPDAAPGAGSGAAAGDGPVAEGSIEVVDSSEAKATRTRRRRRRRRLWLRALRGLRYGLVLIFVFTLLFFTQTGRGQRIILDEVLDRVRGSLAGELTIESIHSRTLLLGLTLEGVRLDAEGGRRFLQADSVVVRYSPLSLAIGSPRIRSATFHGLDVEISRQPGDDFVNVNRIVASTPAADTTPSTPQTIGLGTIGVRNGTLRILVPAEDAPEELTVAAPGGGRLRRIAVDDLDFDIERTIVRTEGPVMVDARLASLSASVSVLSQPLVIHEAQGNLSFGDLGLRIEAGEFRLPGSFLDGGVGFGPDRPGDPWVFAASFDAADWGDLADISWVDPRVPAGRFRGGVDVRVTDGLVVELRDLELQTGPTSVELDGTTRFTDVMSMSGLRVTANPLQLAALEPWVERELPFQGSLRGNATLGGTLSDLAATGRMTFAPDSLPDATTTADFSGTFHIGPNPGGTALQVRLEPFDYRDLAPLWPAAQRLGTGRATFTVDGRADDGLLIVADAVHRSDSATTSRIVGRGMLRRRSDGDWTMDVRAELAALSLPLLGRIWPSIDLPGSVTGPVRVDGRLSDLHMSGDLASEASRVVFDASADVTTRGSPYRIQVDAEALDLAAFTSAFPAPTVFSGELTWDGAGFALDSLEGSAALAVRSARIGGLSMDSISAALRLSDGLLTADSVRGDVAGVLVEGGGSLGMRADREGESRFAFSAETLLGLRPVFMGDSVLVADTLNPLELDALRARGIDPDTLPTTVDVRLAGAVDGTADVRGWLGDLDVDLLFDLSEGAYGRNSVDSAHVSLMASGLPETLGAWEVDVTGSGIVLAGRRFDRARFDGTMLQQRGEGTLEVVRQSTETYFLTGAFALDSLGGELQLTDAEIVVGGLAWMLTRPTRMVWNESSLTVDSLDVRRAGDDPMLLTAAGTLTRGGESDFRMVMQGFHVEQALGLAQREDIDLSGHIDLDLDVTGPAERPVISARIDVEEPRYGGFQLSRVEGSLEYRARSADFELSAWDDTRRVLTAEGVLPINLALVETQDRAVEQPMDLTLRADSLDASLALVPLTTLEDVVGAVSAEMHIGGTPSRPEPSGRVTLADAAWTVEAIGVRHTGVSGELVLQPNRTVAIKVSTVGTSASAGSSTVSGLLRLDPLTNPSLDLAIAFDRFLAVDRRDMQGRISGDLTLTGRYQLPVIEGTLRMEEATLFVDEFARSADIVDLRSPLTYAPGMVVDTTVFVTQPLIAGLRNPFLDNLRVDIDLAVPRELWLRSDEMNVEMGGDLIVRYDRGEGDFVLVGELDALRGSYVVLGRTFEVDGGTASFLGQPGINPTLNIQALSRVRRREGDRLEVRAAVQGTLVEPVVTLSTEEAGLSQSDLISYLVFGQSSAEASAGGLQQGATAAGLTVGTGVLVNELGMAIVQELPLVNRLDYLSFSQSAAIGGREATSIGAYSGSIFSGTQLELGKYLNEDVFVIFVLGGGNGADGQSGTSLTLRGVRMEFAVAENIFLEGFMEDRFIRTGSGGFAETGLDGQPIVGFLLFSEWGYGSQQQQQQQ